MIDSMKLNKNMKRLGSFNYSLIWSAAKQSGTFDPKEIFSDFEEKLFAEEFDTVYLFLKWVTDNKKTFGHATYETIFQEFLSANKK